MMSVYKYREELASEGLPPDVIDRMARRYARKRSKYKQRLMGRDERMAKEKIVKQLKLKYGWADQELVDIKMKKKKEQGSFNPFTQDPNCKSCGKKTKKDRQTNDNKKKSAN